MHVTRLSVTPVKGLALHHPDRIEVTASGVVGDRVFYLVDDRDGLVSIAKTGSLVGLHADYDPAAGRLAIREGSDVVAEALVEEGDGHSANFFAFKQVDGRLAPGPWDEVFSERAGRRLRLVKAAAAGGGHDVEPLTLLGTASTRRLGEQAGVADVDSRRFRMLIEFDGAAAHAEDGWRGERVQIGNATVEGGRTGAAVRRHDAPPRLRAGGPEDAGTDRRLPGPPGLHLRDGRQLRRVRDGGQRGRHPGGGCAHAAGLIR
jgi:uncharacterized protein YcbX